MNTTHHTSFWKRGLAGLSLILAILGIPLSASAQQVIDLRIQAGSDYLPDYENNTTYFKIDLTGIAPDTVSRAPLNIALVVDRSGSMSGKKLQDAKQSAIHFINGLSSQDIVSVITYSSGVEVIIPATKVSDKHELIRRIQQIHSDGNTALFAGVSKGAAEVRKFMNKERINRVILLSDGLANVGPSTPAELGQLGQALMREGISVSTLGIGYGYNEDLMTQLAYNSDGNHVFIAESAELADIFNKELGELLTVTAKNIKLRIHCSNDLKILRILGRDGDILGQTAELYLNQIARDQNKFVLLEVENAQSDSRSRATAEVEVEYFNPFNGQKTTLRDQIQLKRTANREQVKASTNNEVVEAATLMIATLNTEKAVELRDAGRYDEAEEVFQSNYAMLSTTAEQIDSDVLDKAAAYNEADISAVKDEEAWQKKRKQLREEQISVKSNQSNFSSSNRYAEFKNSSQDTDSEDEEEDDDSKEPEPVPKD